MSIRSFLKALASFKTTKKSIMEYGKGSALISSFCLESDICFNLSHRVISFKNRTSQERDALINLGLLDKALEELTRLEGIIDTSSLKNSQFVNVINLILGDNIQPHMVNEYFCFEPVPILITKFPPKTNKQKPKSNTMFSHVNSFQTEELKRNSTEQDLVTSSLQEVNNPLDCLSETEPMDFESLFPPIKESADYFENAYIPYQPDLNFLNLTELSPADLDIYLSCDGNISPEPSGDLVDFLVSGESYPATGNPSPGDPYHIIDDLEEFIFPPVDSLF